MRITARFLCKFETLTVKIEMYTDTKKGSVAFSDCGQKDLKAVRIRSCGDALELLDER